MPKQEEPIVEENKENQPEQPIKGKMLTPDEISDWGNTNVMVEPGVKSEDGKETRATEEPEPDEEEEESLEEEPDEEGVLVQEPVITVEDPGEFQSKDYSFDVTLKDGKSIKINTVDDWDKLLDTDPEFANAGLLLKYQRQATKMESNTERDIEAWQEKKDKFDEAKQQSDQIQQNIETLVKEVEYLVERKDLPAVPDKFKSVDWATSEEARKDPAVKEHLKLINYRERENKARYSRGLSPMSMLDAFTAMQLDATKKRQVEVKKEAGEARREAGARVAGNSAAPVSNAPKGIAVGRGGSLRDISSGWGW